MIQRKTNLASTCAGGGANSPHSGKTRILKPNWQYIEYPWPRPGGARPGCRPGAALYHPGRDPLLSISTQRSKNTKTRNEHKRAQSVCSKVVDQLLSVMVSLKKPFCVKKFAQFLPAVIHHLYSCGFATAGKKTRVLTQFDKNNTQPNQQTKKTSTE